MKLDQTENLKIEHRVAVKKKKEYKLIGRALKQRGQFLFAQNNETGEVYQILIQKINMVDYNAKNASTHKAQINPNHKILYAINLKNAKRKFEKFV